MKIPGHKLLQTLGHAPLVRLVAAQGEFSGEQPQMRFDSSILNSRECLTSLSAALLILLAAAARARVVAANLRLVPDERRWGDVRGGRGRQSRAHGSLSLWRLDCTGIVRIKTYPPLHLANGIRD